MDKLRREYEFKIATMQSRITTLETAAADSVQVSTDVSDISNIVDIPIIVSGFIVGAHERA